MAKTTIVAAQMGNSRVLKPPTNFESAYAGLNATNIPIAIPGGLDFRAGQRGYDPNLMAGIPIVLGTRLLLWLPQAISVEGIPTSPYVYRILWRLRSSGDSAAIQKVDESIQKGLVGHLPVEYTGIPEDNGADPSDITQERMVIPCALQAILFEQTEPTETFNDVTNNLRGERVSVRGQSYAPEGTGQAPILVSSPADKGIASQGVYPNLTGGNGLFSGPTYMPWMVDAAGDEYILLVTRPAGGTEWDFAGEDFGFSQLFGTANGTRQPLPGVGIYALQGSGAT